MSEVRVLLADDHAIVRAGIRKALDRLPNLVIVGEVGDGPALFEALDQTHPDCLLVDVTMPEFDPVTAIRQIRDDHPVMKILVVSAYDDDIYVQGLLSAGVDGYLLKNQSLRDLQLAVERVLAGEKWVSSRLVEKLVSYAEATSLSSPLTARQRDILRLLQQGLDNQTIAQRMGLSIKTIENHLTRLYRHLDVQSRLEAVNYANKYPEVLALTGQVAAQTSLSAEAAEQGCVTILLVDDNVRYRQQLRRMIGRVGLQTVIYEAENINEAINLVKRVTPQLALVDVVLGEENGIYCTRRIRALSPPSRVVLISAYPDREFHRLGLEAGAVAFLDKKDLDVATLQHLVDDVTA